METVSHKFDSAVFPVKVEYILEADGAIFEAPVAIAFFTMAEVVDHRCSHYKHKNDVARDGRSANRPG